MAKVQHSEMALTTFDDLRDKKLFFNVYAIFFTEKAYDIGRKFLGIYADTHVG
jgi:hypothetical protein